MMRVPVMQARPWQMVGSVDMRECQSIRLFIDKVALSLFCLSPHLLQQRLRQRLSGEVSGAVWHSPFMVLVHFVVRPNGQQQDFCWFISSLNKLEDDTIAVVD
ncbi:MAG: hypothetical protein ACKO7W_07580 [Elainella sp.]